MKSNHNHAAPLILFCVVFYLRKIEIRRLHLAAAYCLYLCFISKKYLSKLNVGRT